MVNFLFFHLSKLIFKNLFLSPAPLAFTTTFAVIKPILDQVTIDKIKVFGWDKAEWESALLEEIDADQLPFNYGGTLNDPNGRFDFEAVKKLPENYFIRQVPDRSRLKQLLLPNGTAKEFEFKIEQDGLLLK